MSEICDYLSDDEGAEMLNHGSHGRGSSPAESAGGCLVFLVFIAVCWVLLFTWPWWLLAIPFIVLIPVFRVQKLKEALYKSFSNGIGDVEVNKVRKAVLRALFLLGVGTAFICLLEDVHLYNLAWALFPVLCLCISYRLRSFSVQDKRWPRLRRAVYTNLFEFLAISVAVLGVYSVLMLWLRSLPLDDVTLEKLMRWDERVQAVHEFLELHTPKLATFLLILAFVVALRLMASLRPRFLGVAEGTNKAIVSGTKWFERISTASALAASLTFLATADDGPQGRSD